MRQQGQTQFLKIKQFLEENKQALRDQDEESKER